MSEESVYSVIDSTNVIRHEENERENEEIRHNDFGNLQTRFGAEESMEM